MIIKNGVRFEGEIEYYYLMADGVILNEEKEAAFYNLRHAKKIYLGNEVIKG